MMMMPKFSFSRALVPSTTQGSSVEVTFSIITKRLSRLIQDDSFVEIALLLSLVIAYTFAAPKAVDHDSKVDKIKRESQENFLLVGQ